MEEDQKGAALTQDDFRKLLSTPRAGSAPQSVRGASGSASHMSRKKDEFAAPAPAKKKKWQPKQKEEEEEEDKAQYRDRAKERRDGVNPDYEESDQILAAMTRGAQTGITYEQSKYLGGDVEHTHMVKGLDFTLLAKVRSQLDQNGDEEAADREAMEDEELERFYQGKATDDKQSAAPGGTDHIAALSEILEVEIASSMAKKVFRLAVMDMGRPTLSTSTPLKNELFVPGRLAFAWDLTSSHTDIPTNIIRSKADCKAYQEKINFSGNDIVMEKVRFVMNQLRLNREMLSAAKKAKKKESNITPTQQTSIQHASKPTPKSAIPDDFELFPDAGRYTIEDALGGKVDERATESKEEKADRKDEEENEEAPSLGPQRPSSMDYFAAYAEVGEENRDAVDEADSYPAASSKSHTSQPVQARRAPIKKSWFNSSMQEEFEKDLEAEEEARARGLSDIAGDFQDDAMLASVLKKAAASQKDAADNSKDIAGMRDKGKTAKGTMLAAKDDYDECYPTADGLGSYSFDSDDEEEDITKMDVGTSKKGNISRWDFDNEEDYIKYKERQEAIPKAAFQFGVKNEDGRKKSVSKAAKINKELQQINNLFVNKYNRPDLIVSKRKAGQAGEGDKKRYKDS